MPALHVAPDLDLQLVQQRCVVSLAGEDATLHCTGPHGYGMRINDIPAAHRQVQLWLKAGAERWLQRMAVRGYAYVDRDDIHVYGPFASKLLHEGLLSPSQLNLPPEQVRGVVRGYDPQAKAFQDYVLVANFLKQPVRPTPEMFAHADVPKELS